MAERDERFLSRWSRLKQRARDEDEAPAVAEEASALPAQVDPGKEDSEATANREAAEAIDIDALKYGDDFSPFLKRGVPEPLRRRALRKFFASDPLLANLDGLNDYDEDYNNPEHMVYRSAWNVARGFLTEAEKTAQQATGRLTAAAEEDVREEGDAAAAGPEDGQPGSENTSATPGSVVRTPEEMALPAPDQDPVADAASDEDAMEADPEPAPRRVSIRRRLDG